VVRPAEPRREQRLVRSLAPALVSGGNWGFGDLAAGRTSSIGAVLARVGGPRSLYSAGIRRFGRIRGHLKRAQLPAQRPGSTPAASRDCAGQRRDRVFGAHTAMRSSTRGRIGCSRCLTTAAPPFGQEKEEPAVTPIETGSAPYTGHRAESVTARGCTFTVLALGESPARRWRSGRSRSSSRTRPLRPWVCLRTHRRIAQSRRSITAWPPLGKAAGHGSGRVFGTHRSGNTPRHRTHIWRDAIEGRRTRNVARTEPQQGRRCRSAALGTSP
jgi:hypothetical protein